MTIDPGRWGDYNKAQAMRPVRSLAKEAVAAAGSAAGRTAVELGSGLGREAEFLARHGWTVFTFDADPTVVDRMTDLSKTWPIHHTLAALDAPERLPFCDLLLACASLPFLERRAFAATWQAATAALRPEGILAVDLFGVRDDWATGVGTFVDAGEVAALLDGFEVLALKEQERDGQAFSGPKHWHTFEILARKQ